MTATPSLDDELQIRRLIERWAALAGRQRAGALIDTAPTPPQQQGDTP